MEASLDIDFDFLFTELSDLNGLFQRLGRVNRKGKKEVNDYNCYVFTEINKNLLIKLLKQGGNMKRFSIHGTEEGNTTSIKLDEIAILADPDTLLKIGEFIIKTAHVMKGYEVDYSQLQDEVSDFDYKNNTDIIIYNQDYDYKSDID